MQHMFCETTKGNSVNFCQFDFLELEDYMKQRSYCAPFGASFSVTDNMAVES